MRNLLNKWVRASWAVWPEKICQKSRKKIISVKVLTPRLQSPFRRRYTKKFKLVSWCVSVMNKSISRPRKQSRLVINMGPLVLDRTQKRDIITIEFCELQWVENVLPIKIRKNIIKTNLKQGNTWQSWYNSLRLDFTVF